MTHPRIMEEIYRSPWGITPTALSAIIAAVEGTDLTVADATSLHGLRDETLGVSPLFGRQVTNTLYSSVRDNVGFLNLDGPIIPRATLFSNASGLVALDVLSAEFKALENNEALDTIVLLSSTPGGVVDGTSDFASLVKATSKRTITYGWQAASCGYWIASATDERVSPDTGMWGCVGVIMATTDTTEADKKRGVTKRVFVSSQSPDKRPDLNTPEGRSVNQTIVDDLAAVFVSTVAKNVGVTEDTVVNSFGKGSVLVAHKALAAGAIDKIQTPDDFIKGIIVKPKYVGFNAARAALTEGEDMPSENPTMTAEELTAQYPSVIEQIKAEAVISDRNRIKAIEALANEVADSPQTVKDAVQAVIAEHKFEASATADNVAMKVAKAAMAAHKTVNVDYAAQHTEGNEAAAHASTARASVVDNPERARAEQRKSALLAAKKASEVN